MNTANNGHPRHLQRPDACFESPPSGAKAFVVAFSGGADSTALLHLVSAAAKRQGIECRAIHVDHGIHPQSSQWAAHCQQIADRLKVPIEVCRAELDTANRNAAEDLDDLSSPHNLEARARDARYAVFRSRIAAGDILITAHHREDQTETVLLRLMRGAGSRGLSGIAVEQPFGGGRLWRPLLQVESAALREVCRRNDLQWIDDPSNGDRGFDRNFLRHEVLPRLRERWADVDGAVARSAQRARDAEQTLMEVAARDKAALAVSESAGLSASGLSDLPQIRRANVLRLWASEYGLTPPAMDQVVEFDRSMATAGIDRMPTLQWGNAELRRYRDRLYLMPQLPDAPPTDDQAVFAFELAGVTELPAGCGSLTLSTVTRAGGERVIDDLSGARTLKGPIQIDATEAEMVIRFPVGGERIRQQGHAQRSRVKQLCQSLGVPPWSRQRMPLLFAGDELLAVAGFWRAAGFHQRFGADARLHWHDAPVGTPAAPENGD